MSVRTCLKKARERIVGGERDLYMAICFSAATDSEADDALDVVERVTCPAYHSYIVQAERWAETGNDADGLRAVELVKRPGGAMSLAAWLKEPGLKVGHVLKALTTAILKSYTVAT